MPQCPAFSGIFSVVVQDKALNFIAHSFLAGIAEVNRSLISRVANFLTIAGFPPFHLRIHALSIAHRHLLSIRKALVL